jgi:hypothetical protein
MCSDAISSVLQAKADMVSNQIGIAVTRKSLDAQQLQGDAAVELLEVATEIAKQLGKGVEFDARA